MARRASTSSTRRGAALLIAIVSIAVVTALTVDLAYQTRVTLQASANARDELRAEWQARSGIAFSRLVLHFQQQLDRSAGQAAALAGGAAGLAGQAGGGAATPPAGLPGGLPLSVRLWELVPVDSTVAGMLIGEGMSDAEDAEEETHAPTREPGADGSFQAKIEDEDGKINVRQLNALGALPAAQAARLTELVKDPRYDFLFDEEDANGIRVTRRDLLGYLRDWTDEDDVTSVYTGNPLQPFEPGFADENGIYQRLDDRYLAKDAWYDSLAELHLVAGVSDAFMAAFGDSLTVYPDVNAPININAADRTGLIVNALVMSDPPGIPQPPLLEPGFEQRLDAALMLVRPVPFMSMSPQQFAMALQSLGIKVQQLYTQATNTDSRAAFGDSSTTFRIRATGRSGVVTKNLDAVVTFDQRAGPLAQDLGRVVHWNED
jgi:general secretion pathway protein K